MNSDEIKRARPPRWSVHLAGPPPSLKWPNFKVWDERDKFELYEAACLWFLLEPVLPMPENPKALYQEWKHAIENDGMPAEFTGDKLDDSIMYGIAKHGSAVGIEDGKPFVAPHTLWTAKFWSDGRKLKA